MCSLSTRPDWPEVIQHCFELPGLFALLWRCSAGIKSMQGRGPVWAAADPSFRAGRGGGLSHARGVTPAPGDTRIAEIGDAVLR